MNFSEFMKKHRYKIITYIICIVIFFFGCLVGSLTDTKAEAADAHEQPKAVALVSTAKSNEKNLGEFKITAYCPCSKCCGKYSDGITATGTTATPGRTIAVDPDVIPYGTEVIIDGNTFIAEDCGGAVKGKHIDVFCASHELALEWGVQYKNIEIIERNETK